MRELDKTLLLLWQSGATVDDISVQLSKSPTSIASKLVRLDICKDRTEVNSENKSRGGNLIAKLEHDGFYTIYVVREPTKNVPIYIGQTQNFLARQKQHLRTFTHLKSGKMPLIEKIETVETYELARKLEKKIIADYTKAGYVLHNVLDRELCSI